MALPISTERLNLRDLAHSDTQDLIEIVSHPSAARVAVSLGTTKPTARAYIDRQRSYQPFQKGKYYDLAMERKADAKVVGLFGLMREADEQGLMG